VSVVLATIAIVGSALAAAVWYAVWVTRRLRRTDSARVFLESILNKIGDPVFVKDRAHRLVLVNDAECRLSGHRREDLVGKTDYDFFPTQQVDVFWQQDDLVFATGNENLNEEGITDANGVVRTIVTKKTRYVDLNGTPYIVGVIRDISDRKEAEEQVRKLNLELERRVAERTAELEREKERLAVTLRSLGDGVLATDTERCIQLMNSTAEKITGWPIAEALGRKVDDVFCLREKRPDRENRGALDLAMDLPAGATRESQERLIARDGRTCVISLNVAPIRGPQESPLGAVLVFRDITEKQQTEEKLANAHRLESIGVLAAGIAHDFNNLLTGVFGHLEITREMLANDVKANEHLSEALAAWRRAKDLTQQLLTFAKGGEPVKKPTDVGALVRQTVHFVLSGSAIASEIRVPPDLAPCDIDEGQIAQVIDNVVINAVQAMGPGGRLFVEARNVATQEKHGETVLPDRHVEIAIRDTGPGIPAEISGKVFDPFFSTKPDGSGLGLTTAYSIMRRHEGRIEIDSGLERGTTVTLRLPACTAAAVEAIRRRLTARPSGAKILVIDDEQAVRTAFFGLLSLRGHSVTVASSGRDGIICYRSARDAGSPFDLVIVDLTIPGDLGGTATLEQIRSIDPRVRAIATSGYSENPVMAEPGRFGFAHTLPKPFTLADIDAVLGDVLGTPLEAPEHQEH
jgi:two-component system, cell cycle sensor histidine kinase and response regulator CckA